MLLWNICFVFVVAFLPAATIFYHSLTQKRIKAGDQGDTQKSG
jgi:hypothetical protein